LGWFSKTFIKNIYWVNWRQIQVIKPQPILMTEKALNLLLSHARLYLFKEGVGFPQGLAGNQLAGLPLAHRLVIIIT
jgi:hypothetical protein